jgi:hypothetical protein
MSGLRRTLVAFIGGMAVVWTAAQAPADIQPVKAFDEIPTLPKTAAEVWKVYGKVRDSEGREHDGDTRTAVLEARVGEWTKAITQQMMAQAMNPAAMRGAAARPSPGAMQSMGALAQAVGRVNTATLQAQQRYTATVTSLRGEHEKQDAAIEQQYQKEQNDLRCMSSAERAGGVAPAACETSRRQRDSAHQKNGEGFLRDAGNAYEELFAHLKAAATDAQTTMDQAERAMGTPIPAMARGQFQGLGQMRLTAVVMTLSAEDDLVKTAALLIGPKPTS